MPEGLNSAYKLPAHKTVCNSQNIRLTYHKNRQIDKKMIKWKNSHHFGVSWCESGEHNITDHEQQQHACVFLFRKKHSGWNEKKVII